MAEFAHSISVTGFLGTLTPRTVESAAEIVLTLNQAGYAVAVNGKPTTAYAGPGWDCACYSDSMEPVNPAHAPQMRSVGW